MSEQSSMHLIQDHGNQLTLASVDMSRRKDGVPPGLYRNPEINEATGFITMDKVDNLFQTPARIYGKANSYCDLIMSDYNPKGDTIGVLLIGTKGMGKSMLAEMLSMKVLELGFPIIHITKRINPVTIPKLLEIVGPCALYMDEFEKCFDQMGDVPIFLNTLSDSTLKGCMVIISANTLDIHKYDPLLDRPQRLKYRINYGKLTTDTINQILSDHEVSPEQKSVYLEWAISSNPNIDSLITLVRMTSHITDGCELVDFISILNVPSLNPPRYEPCKISVVDWSFKIIQPHPYTVEVKSSDSKNAITISVQGPGFNKQTIVPLPTIEDIRENIDLTPRLVDVGDESTGTITFEVIAGITRAAGEKTIKCKVSLNEESVGKEPMPIISEYMRNKTYSAGLEWWE